MTQDQTERADTATVQGQDQQAATITIPQYSLGSILTIWAAAALPMAVLAWLVAPRLAATMSGQPFAAALIVCLTVGLAWQFVLVLALVGREQHSLRWRVLRDALWLRAPRSPRTGRVGGIVWLAVVPFALLFAAKEFMPKLAAPLNRDFGAFLGSDAGDFLPRRCLGLVRRHRDHGRLQHRPRGRTALPRLPPPRMNGTFGRADWVANGVLFAAYHLHVPWTIPINLIDTVTQSYADQAFPQCMDRHRRTQHSDRLHHHRSALGRAVRAPSWPRGHEWRSGLPRDRWTPDL